MSGERGLEGGGEKGLDRSATDRSVGVRIQKMHCKYPAFMMDQRASTSAKAILLKHSDLKACLCKSCCSRDATNTGT